ncbi:pentatricopeptide repeat-containing protein At4g19191, mitochondrial-like [Alnus glutinosa]|uniref:pentatricopeptide repeat-containing protein At4g19191, mitochondrial-like n=1 Tax=Alnus glutinosa TaxID=3517 RepID=UPI002D77DECA|nr:pentatricopeptide repeat-containing protein At4g19191, mitochondrial-like [Alnus glutinosa]
MPQIQQLRRLVPNHFPHFPATQTKPFGTLSSLLNLCTKPQHLQQIHARFTLHGLHQNPALSSKLIDSYANLGLLHLAQQVFNSISNPSSVLYNANLRSLSRFGEHERTLLVYQEMVTNSMYPDEDAYPFVLGSCSCLPDVQYGKKAHGHVVKLGFDSFDLVDTALVEMYRNCGDFDNENELVVRKSVCDLGSWNSLIFEASQDGNAEECFRLFEKMRMKRVEPDSVTIINLLRSSVDLRSLQAGKAIHCLVVVSNLCKDLAVNTALLSMYTKLGSLEVAQLLFEKMPEKDSVVWNITISAYSRNGYLEKSLELLRCMVRSGVRPDLFTALPVISSITQLKSIEWGKQLHAHVIRNGSDYQVSVHNSLIDMYCECDYLNSARKIFDSLINKTVVSWSAIIKGYVTHDKSADALSLFAKMKAEGVRVDFVIVINILPACVNIGALENVKYLHGYSLKFGLNLLSSVNTALLISYAKCGCIEMARKIFDEEKSNGKDLIMWNSMISAYAKHGDWSKCFELHNQMKHSNFKPDQVTFLGLLTACVNSGLVKEGKECFKEMMETYGFQPTQEHYACMVDLLGRAGQMDEARELIETMPFKPDAQVWGPLLSACKMHSETMAAEFAAEKLITMEPKNAGNYILLSNIYAAAGKWDGVAKMRTFLRDRGLKKTPGSSWLEVNGHVHEFRVADQSHTRSDDIYTILRNIELEIKEARKRSSEIQS